MLFSQTTTGQQLKMEKPCARDPRSHRSVRSCSPPANDTKTIVQISTSQCIGELKIIMRKQIKFGTPQQKIVEDAKKMNASWVVVWCDHCPGNSKGYFQSVANFAQTTTFRRNEAYEDRGATQVYITDEDIPELVSQRQEIANEIERQNFILSEMQEKQQYIAIDGRWGKNNPKYIEAIARREAQALKLEEAKMKYDYIVSPLVEKLQALNFVDATFWELR